MRYVNENYISVFKDCISQTSEQTGYTLPADIEAYCAILLGSYIDQPNFLPEGTFAENYLQITKQKSYQAKELADVCLIVVGVFETVGTMPKEYYSNIGKSSYDIASKQLNYRLFAELCQHFDVVAQIIKLSTTSKQTPRII